MQLQIGPEKLNELFPFHLLIGKDGMITSVGRSLHKMLPGLVAGQQFLEQFESQYPAEPITEDNLFALQATAILHYRASGEKFKMQPAYIQEYLLLTGHPFIDSTFHLEKYQLHVTDFAQHNGVIEQLFLAQASKRSLAEAAAVTQELKHKNEELQKSEARYQMVVDSVHDIIFQTDAEGYWTFLNKAWEDVLGFTVEESIGQLFFRYLHPDDVQRNQELFEPLILRKKSYCSHQIRYLAKDGGIKWIRVYAILTFDDKGNISGTAGTLQDITLQKESFEKYELLANNITDLVCILDMQGTFTYVSPSITKLTGFLPEQLIGTNGVDYLHPADMRTLTQARKHLKAGNFEIDNVQHRFKTTDGRWRWMESAGRMTKNEAGVTTSIVMFARVVEERKRAEQATIKAMKELQEVSNLKSKFISLVSHEMRTPMTSIYSGVEIMEMYAAINHLQNPTFANQFRIIKGEVERLNSLIDKILFWGKVEGGKVKNHREQVNLCEFITDLCARHNQMQTDGRIVQLSCSGEPRNLFIDPLHLENIIGNLISNAFKYSKGKREPELQVDYADHFIKLSVRDYGSGIPEKEMPHLFKSFFRASNVEHIEGNGLGMVIVKYFAEVNNAAIQVYSKENEGTEISINFKTGDPPKASNRFNAVSLARR
ncbi:MAG: PAS domain S-box protein [Chitinophagales bacterium]